MRRIVCAAAAGLLTAVAAACQDGPAPVHGVEEGFVLTDDEVRLYYQLQGTGTDTVVVLHGGPGLSSPALAPDLDILARDHVLIFYDQRGTGRSTVVKDSARLRLADHVRDLEAVRRHFGLERVTVLGHSWGAALAAHYARVHAQRTARLVMVSPMAIRATPHMQQYDRNLRSWMDSATAARVAALDSAYLFDPTDPVAACREFWRVFIRGSFADPQDMITPARMRGDPCDAPPEAIRNIFLVNTSVIGPLGNWDWRDEFAQMPVPTLIIHGDKDPMPVASAAEWEAALPTATLSLVEGAGHFPYIERPEAFTRLVNTFLSK